MFRAKRFLPALLPALAAGMVVPGPAAEAAEIRTPIVLQRIIASHQVVESSGLARSTYRRPVLWTHNDSGGKPAVFAVGGRGKVRATVTLRGARSLDWEDIAAGPGRSLWVGDVGNNSGRRSVISLYRFVEPRVLVDQSVPAARFDFRYPDGNHNAEGILVHPVNGRVFVVTKDPNGGALYRAPRRISTRTVNPLRRILNVPAKVTGAAFIPGGGFVMCNYSDAWVYRSLRSRPVRIATPALRQGESIEVNRRGTAVLMGSEGRFSPVYRVALP